MKQQLVIALLMAVFTASMHAQSDRRRDGNWWNQKTVVEKVDYVTGFFDGMSLGHEFSYWGIASKDDNSQNPCLEKIAKSYGDYGNKFFSNVTNSQLADGLDEFYKDYRNRSIEVYDAVWVVVNSIAGTPQEKIDRLVENLRKNAASDGN